MTEKQVRTQFSEIILNVVNNPMYPNRKGKICSIYHISKRMLSKEKLLDMKGMTFFRLMMGIAQEAHISEYDDMVIQMRELTLSVAEMEDGTPESIIDAHKGLKIGVKKLNQNKKEGKK